MTLIVIQINYGLIGEQNFTKKYLKEWLDNNDILMLSTHNEGKCVITERFIKTLKDKIFKEMIANDSKPYLSYLSKLVDQYNNNNIFQTMRFNHTLIFFKLSD